MTSIKRTALPVAVGAKVRPSFGFIILSIDTNSGPPLTIRNTPEYAMGKFHLKFS
jgi:hypothetical protein